MNALYRRNDLPRSRRGVAPLELVLALPMLAAFWMLLMWLGEAVVAQTHATVEARRQTTAERFDVTEGDPLLFLQNGLVTGDQTTLSRTVEQRVAVNHVTEKLPIPESTFTMQAGTWDHRQLPLDDAPSWAEMTTIAVSGGLSRLQGVIADVKGIADDPEDFAAGAFASIFGDSGGGTSGGGAPIPEPIPEPEASTKEVNPEKLRKRRDDADEKLRQLEPQKLASQIELAKLVAEDELLSLSTDPKKRQSVRDQLEIERNRLWRLNSDIEYYKTDRDNAQKALD